MKTISSWLAFLAVLVLAVTTSSQPTPREQVGMQPDGKFLLNSGWRVKPAGQQVTLDTFPMSSVVTRDGRYMIVLNGGYKPPSLSVLDLKSAQVVHHVPVADAWLGLALSRDGKTVWVGGGSTSSVYEFTVAGDGSLAPARTFEIVPEGKRTWEDFIGDVAVSPDGRSLFASDLYHDQILVISLQSGRVTDKFKTGRRPYRILFHPDGKSFFVTSWADGTLLHHETGNGNRLETMPLGPHPTDIVWRDRRSDDEDDEQARYKARLFVSAANTNNVYALGINEGNELHRLETINVAMTYSMPLGMTPSALGLSADSSKLYVVCSDANVVAMVDVTEERSHVLGFIPVGWYPTAVRAIADGRLVVLNGRGAASYPNPKGPNPTKRSEVSHEGVPLAQYVGVIQLGSASIIPPVTEEMLDGYTKEAMANSPYNDDKLGPLGPLSKPSAIPVEPGQPSPIQHVIYIVKENRTYDQVLGDIGKGESDPSLVIFDEKTAPNHHKLAREFVLLDNFYVNADVSADGHSWSTGAIGTDYIQKMWPNSYAKRRKHYDYEEQDPASVPPAGYLWTNAAQRNISLRNYGYMVNNRKEPGADGVQVDAVRDPVLRPVTNLGYRGFDLDYQDVKRAQTFIGDLHQFEANNNMPQLIVMRMGNDHTSGTAAGKIAPLSSFADNDYALGMIVEAVSHSKFWTSTAIFVLEDDAQNGPDHIDSHRSPAFVISPYTHTGTVDGTMYNTTSMLRTMELILGLRPMTQFDAAARPMFNAFAAQGNNAPYTAEKPRISIVERNPAGSATAARSAEMDFSDADRADDDELNDILWRAIRHTQPPVPVRSFFGR